MCACRQSEAACDSKVCLKACPRWGGPLAHMDLPGGQSTLRPSSQPAPVQERAALLPAWATHTATKPATCSGNAKLCGNALAATLLRQRFCGNALAATLLRQSSCGNALAAKLLRQRSLAATLLRQSSCGNALSRQRSCGKALAATLSRGSALESGRRALACMMTFRMGVELRRSNSATLRSLPVVANTSASACAHTGWRAACVASAGGGSTGEASTPASTCAHAGWRAARVASAGGGSTGEASTPVSTCAHTGWRAARVASAGGGSTGRHVCALPVRRGLQVERCYLCIDTRWRQRTHRCSSSTRPPGRSAQWWWHPPPRRKRADGPGPHARFQSCN